MRADTDGKLLYALFPKNRPQAFGRGPRNNGPTPMIYIGLRFEMALLQRENSPAA
jgi:hypothetical protein